MKVKMPWVRSVLTAGTVLLVGAVLAILAVWSQMETPVDQATNSTVIVTVETGETLGSIAPRLAQDGLVPWAEGFRLYGRIRKLPLQAGEFELSAAMSPRRILEILAFGKPILHRLHFAEGLTMREVALAVNATGLTTAERFLEACNSTHFLAQNGITAPNAEGYLFPETYFFPRIPDQNPYPILKAMLERFKSTVKDLDQPADPDKLHQMVILASLVEKETAVPSERERVAGVYARRLKIGMLLQCDPTIIYGLGDGFDGNLRRSHLQDPDNLYNTYVHPGLPPGPICSPGRASLMAAANPEEHNFLYFVAKPDGSHHFSPNLREHTNAVIKYQRAGRPFPDAQRDAEEK